MPRRWATSGKLTPAAATRTSTSPAPGSGTGRVHGRSIPGPPGSVISIAFIEAGTASVIAGIWGLVGTACLSRPSATHWQGGYRETGGVEEEDLNPKKGPAKLRDLDSLSIEELEEYIAEMEAEIRRVRADIEKKQRHRAGVEGLFKRG